MSNQVRIQDIDRQIQDLQSLSPLLKKYAEIVPDDIRNMYLKQVEIWKENLTVKSRL